MAWSKGTLGLAQGEGKQEMSRLSQRQGLCLSGWGGERLGWLKLPLSSCLGKQWFHGKGCHEGHSCWLVGPSGWQRPGQAGAPPGFRDVL